MTAAVAAQVLRELQAEVHEWMTRLAASPRLDTRSLGHLEALRHVATVIESKTRLARRARRPRP